MNYRTKQLLSFRPSKRILAIGIASLIVIGITGSVIFSHNAPTTIVLTPTTHKGTPQTAKTDPDAPTVLVKDPETGETTAVSQNDIKNNPSLAAKVIKAPTAADYQSAGVSQPSNPAMYDCLDTSNGIMAKIDGGGFSVDKSQCKTVTKETFPAPSVAVIPTPPAQTGPVYVSSTFLKSYADGACTTQNYDMSGSNVYPYNIIVYSDGRVYRNGHTDIIPMPNFEFDSNCRKYVQFGSTYQINFTLSSTSYHMWQFSRETVQKPVLQCTVDGVQHYLEGSGYTGPACDLYKQNSTNWITG